MLRRSFGLAVVLLLLGNGGASAEWVWGSRSGKSVVASIPSRPTATPTDAPLTDSAVAADEGFVAFTEAPDTLPVASFGTDAAVAADEGFVAFTEAPDTLPIARVVQGTNGGGGFVAETVKNTTARESRVIGSEAYDAIYGDPKVQAALEAGNETEARFFIRDKLCFLGLVDCEDDYPRPPRRRPPPPGPLPNNVLYVQPIKVVPNGPPVPALPLGAAPPLGHPNPAHGGGGYPAAVSSHYSPPKPAYSPPKPAYGPPRPAYSPPKPAYSPPRPAYSPPKPAYHPPPSNGYGPPKGAYPAPRPSHYSPPHHDNHDSYSSHDSHDSHGSHDSHSVHLVTGPHDSGDDSHSSHDSGHDSHSSHPIVPSPVVQHHHTHHHTHLEAGRETHLEAGRETHLEAGRPGKSIALPVYPPTYTPQLLGVNRGPQLGVAASTNSATFANGNVVPSAVKIANRPHFGRQTPGLNGGFGGVGGVGGFGGVGGGIGPGISLGPGSGLGSQYYGEYCVCVPRYACDVHDVISARAGRGTGDLSAISPRSNQLNHTVLARAAKSLDGGDVLAQVKAVISEEKSAATFQFPAVSRRRRRRATAEVPEGRQAVTDTQGRQLGYQPNHRGCFHTDVCCRNPVPAGTQRRRQPGQCGVGRTDAVNGRIKNYDVREGETVFGEFPWHVAILKKEGADNVYVCAGSLIGDEYILTAAHCVKSYDPYALRVRLGEWDVNHETEFYPHVEKDVSGIYIHPDFYGGNLYNDVAILKLSSPVDTVYNLHVGPVCIPPQYADFTSQRCWVSGWGKDAFGDYGNFQNVLKKVAVPVLSNYDCEQKLRRTRLGYDFQLHDGFICAGGEEGKDSCKGDGGGPLVCDQAGTFYLAGIVSWGVGCGQRDVPGVYIKVSEYLPWIQSITTYRPYAGIQSRTRKRAEGIRAEDYIEVIRE